jgi:type IV pilus biogenesis protein CpaD/CtpE
LSARILIAVLVLGLTACANKDDAPAAGESAKVRTHTPILQHQTGGSEKLHNRRLPLHCDKLEALANVSAAQQSTG